MAAVFGNLASALTKPKDPDAEASLLFKWTPAVCDIGVKGSCVAYAQHLPLIAAGSADGKVTLFDAESGIKKAKLLAGVAPPAAYPVGPAMRMEEPADIVMAVRFNPSSSRSKLVRVAAGNSVHLFDVTSKNTSAKNTCKEGTKNVTKAVDFSPDGEAFATGGVDKVVRVYGEATSGARLVSSMEGSSAGDHGHSNSIQAVRYISQSEIVSASMDATIKLWDSRAQRPSPLFSLGGFESPCLDYHKGTYTLAVGSARPSHNLQLYDLRNMTEPMETYDIKWRKEARATGKHWAMLQDKYRKNCCVLSVKLFADKIVAGGTGTNELKVFSRTVTDGTDAAMPLPVAKYYVPSGVQGLDVSAKDNVACIASTDGTVHAVPLDMKLVRGA